VDVNKEEDTILFINNLKINKVFKDEDKKEEISVINFIL